MSNLPLGPIVTVDLPLHERRLLNSWKEIAAYAGRGVCTVQRYELYFGFPVRRPAGKSRSSVMAFCDEVDAWLSQTPTRLAATSAAGHSNGIQMQGGPANHPRADGGVCPFCNGTGTISQSEVTSEAHVPPSNPPAKDGLAKTPFVMVSPRAGARPGLGSNESAKANGTYRR